MSKKKASRTSKHGQVLVDQFVSCFEKFDDLIAFGTDPAAEQLVIGGPDRHGFSHWRPARFQTDLRSIDQLYASLPARFPPLFETLLFSYRWAEVDLENFTLLANPSGPGLGGFFRGMSKDPVLWKHLIPSGYLQFGRAIIYDPICFDVRSRRKDGDCRIVRIDHEEILCNDRLKITSEFSPSFEQLMLETIARADMRTSKV